MTRVRLLRLSASLLCLGAVIAAAGCPAGGEKKPAGSQAQAAAKDRPVAVPAVPADSTSRALPESPALPRYETPAARVAAEIKPPAEPDKPSENSASLQEEPALREKKPAPRLEKPFMKRPKTKKNGDIPFDPIKENGPIFVDWPKPKLALLISGREEGYIEPCGCAGLDRMKGGMGRRFSLFQKLRRDGWPVVGLDVGGIARGFGRQAEIKFRTMVEGKLKMGYDGITFGADDLRLPAGELLSVAAGVDGKPSPFLSANVALFGFDANMTAKTRVVEAGGRKVGITGVLGKQFQSEINNPEIEMIDPVAALQKVVPELKRKADYLVLLAHATREESIELGKKFPEFNVVVTAGGPPDPPATPKTIEGTKTLLIEVGYKGMHAIVLGLYDDPREPVRYQRVPLDSRFATAPEMKALMAAYQDQLKAIGFAGLGLRPVPHPLKETNGRFIGSQKCESCHEISYNIWKKSGHAHAYQTLVELDPPRNFDPECVSCHVIGWHPTKYFPYTSGYQSVKKTPDLVNVGCDDCHGPGEEHADAELGNNLELQKKLRKAVVVTKAESEKQQCSTCHDGDNSPDFDFKTYWPFVEHYEKEAEEE